MKLSKRDERFLQSTQGQIVLLLRGKELTVDDLAQELALTGNAVRSHLTTLERDGLIEEVGMRPGVRKSHKTYSLSRQGDQLFPKAFDLLLNQLLSTLKARLPAGEVLALVRETGKALAPESETANNSLDKRLALALKVLEQIGGCANLCEQNGTYIISSSTCPLGAIACHHPEICELARALLESILQVPVTEECTHDGCPRCKFKIPAPIPRAASSTPVPFSNA